MGYPKLVLSIALACAALSGQQTAPAMSGAAWKGLAFLEGTWDAKTPGAGVASSGAYTFAREFGAHVLTRHSTTADCKGPSDFDCAHRDLLYIYEDAPGRPLKAIYFDSEGHVLHYSVSAPAPNSALFLTDASLPGPQFRLVYELKGSVMSGKFQMHLPGAADWQSYLEWSGAKK